MSKNRLRKEIKKAEFAVRYAEIHYGYSSPERAAEIARMIALKAELAGK